MQHEEKGGGSRQRVVMVGRAACTPSVVRREARKYKRESRQSHTLGSGGIKSGQGGSERTKMVVDCFYLCPRVQVASEKHKEKGKVRDRTGSRP